jgi:hypothetical protein
VSLKQGSEANRLYVSPGYSNSKGFNVKTAYSFYFSPKLLGRAYVHPSKTGDNRWGMDVRFKPRKGADGQLTYSRFDSKTINQNEERLRLSHRQRLSKTASYELETVMTSINRLGTGTDEELNLNFGARKTLKDWELELSFQKRVDLDDDEYLGDSAVQSLDATPRLFFRQRRAHRLLGEKLTWRLDGRIERIKELAGGVTRKAVKEELTAHFTPKPLDIGRWSKWQWNFRETLSFYSSGENRQTFGLNVNTLERYGTRLSTAVNYSVQRVSGESPFSTYDLLTDFNRGTWFMRYNRPGHFNATLFQTSFDFERGFFTAASSNLVWQNPSTATVNWSSGFTFTYDVGTEAQGLGNMKLNSISSNMRIARKDAWRHSLITNYDIRQSRLSSVTAQTDFLMTPSVKLQANANFSYDLAKDGLDRTRLGVALIKDLHCWEGRLRWDVEQEEAFLEFYLKASARKKLSIGLDYQEGFEVDPQMIDGERPGTSFSAF